MVGTVNMKWKDLDVLKLSVYYCACM